MSCSRYVCQTPQAFCGGGRIGTSQSLNHKDSIKAHSSPQEAYNCHANYLVSEGYTKGENNMPAVRNGGIFKG
jgi:hypothetical protein